MFREGAPYQRRGSLQLWQFLVALLDDPSNAHFIAWTGRGMEFKLIEPEEVNLKTFKSSQEAEYVFYPKTLMPIDNSKDLEDIMKIRSVRCGIYSTFTNYRE